MIYVYSSNARDFSSNGLGILSPNVCEVKEEAGGDFSIYIEHPVTDDLRYTLLSGGAIVKCPVPKRETPFISNKFDGQEGVPERVIYRVKNKASLRTKGYVDAPVIEWLAKGTEVLFNGTQGMVNHSVVTSPSGSTGRIYNEVIEYVRTEPAIPGKPAYTSIIPAREVRDQLFRMYDPEIDSASNTLKIRGRHISYDQLGAINLSYNPQNETLQSALNQLKASLDHDNGFNYYTDILDAFSADWANKNAVFALQDPDEGAVAKLGARLVRDNYDIFLLKDREIDRGLLINEGKNLKGVKVKVADGDIVTRLIPQTTNKEGKKILLPEKYVDSPHIASYPVVKAQILDLSFGSDISGEELYKKMREACKKHFERGCDIADTQIDVEFVNLGDTKEYEAYKKLMQLFLYDSVTVRKHSLGMEYKAKMIGYTYDVLRGRYKKIKLGNPDAVGDLGVIAGYQIPSSAVSASKILDGAVGSSKLRDLSVGRAHIQNAAIGSAQIGQAVIDAAHIKDAAITKAKIANASIDSAKIEDASIGNAKIDSAGIDYAKIKDLVAGTAIIEAGIGEKLIIKRLSVTDANIVDLAAGRLLVQGQDGAMYQLTVGADGTVKTIKKQIGNNDVKDESLHAGEKIIKGTIVADLLDVQEIFANSALIGAIKAQNIAAQEITVNHLAADVGRTLDISSNEAINLKASVADLEKIKEYGQNLLKNSGRKYTSTAYCFAKYEFDEELEEGETYTFSAKIKLGANKQYLLVYNSGGIVSNAWLNMSYQHDGIWQYTGQWTKKNGQSITADNKSLWLFAYPSDAVSQTEVEWVKIERGDRVTLWCPAYGEAKELKSSHISIDNDKIAVKSGGIVDVEAGGHLHLAGGTVQLDAQESSGSYINIGGVFSVGEGDNGEFELHLNAKDGAMKVGGHKVLHRGNFHIGQNAPPAGHETIWLKPNTTSEVSFFKPAAGGRPFYFGWGDASDGYLHHDLAAQNQNTIGAGPFNVTLSFVLTRKGLNATGTKNYGRIQVFLKKSGQILSATHPDDLTLKAYQSKSFSFTFSTSSPAFTNNAAPVEFGVKAARPQYNDRDFLCFKTPSDITAKFVTSGGGTGAGLCEVRYVP